jgi:hypothetical protein
VNVPVRLIAVLAAAAGLAACGSDAERSKPAPGSPQNPLVAKQSSVDGEEPSFKGLVDRQRDQSVRRDSSNPCAFVTKAEAERIVGARLLDPVVASQGPTCIYRNRSGQSFTTISIQAQPLERLRRQADRVRTVDVADRKAYCGVRGAPVLYLPLSRGQVLSVAAPCEIAVRLAVRATPRLP